MARLNEPPVSMDTLETLRRKMLRQNRDLAKLNNIRALRIRELENECACMLSENLELRGRILELEKQAKDSEARRIADHAMVIKDKLESQLTEWATVLAGLGLEPPPKRHSPLARRTSKQRMSFSAQRPSPSQRRLRDIAREIEDLGHISENKTFPRRSMNHEQILALRSGVEVPVSPELGPPPTSDYIDEDPVKVDSPTPLLPQSLNLSPDAQTKPPIILSSPTSDKHNSPAPSPTKKKIVQPLFVDDERKTEKTKLSATAETAPSQPVQTGSKRKFVHDNENLARPTKQTNENLPPRMVVGKSSVREKTGGKTLKELAASRKQAPGQSLANSLPRKPLSAKHTNDDVSSPKRKPQPAKKEPPINKNLPTAKDDMPIPKVPERLKPKVKSRPLILIGSDQDGAVVPTKPTAITPELEHPPLTETAILSPTSPEPTPSTEAPRGDTPPPADISSLGEATRPSRRARAAVSYAEPNLRDKMRRPTKELFDAVTGEGRYARRQSHFEQLPDDKRESGSIELLRSASAPKTGNLHHERCSISVSPLAGKMAPQESSGEVISEKRKKKHSTAAKMESVVTEDDDDGGNGSTESSKDLYDFSNSTLSTPEEAEASKGKGKSSCRQSKASSRRYSAAVDSDDEYVPRERGASRRRSMMV